MAPTKVDTKQPPCPRVVVDDMVGVGEGEEDRVRVEVCVGEA